VSVHFPTFAQEASDLLDLLESDFGRSGSDVQFEAIRVELAAAFKRGFEAGRAATSINGEHG